jgi:hypothetical protein
VIDGAESKDPDGAYVTHAARSFSITEARSWRIRDGLSLRQNCWHLATAGGSTSLLDSNTGGLHIGVTSIV